jgi:hypothetical protein
MAQFTEVPPRCEKVLVLNTEDGDLIAQPVVPVQSGTAQSFNGARNTCIVTFNNRPQDIERLQQEPEPGSALDNRTVRRALLTILTQGEDILYLTVSAHHITVTYSRPYTEEDLASVVEWCRQVEAGDARTVEVAMRVIGTPIDQADFDVDEDDLDPENVQDHEVTPSLLGVTAQVETADSELFEMADRWLVRLADDTAEIDLRGLSDLLLDLGRHVLPQQRRMLRTMLLQSTAGEMVDRFKLRKLLQRLKLKATLQK